MFKKSMCFMLIVSLLLSLLITPAFAESLVVQKVNATQLEGILIEASEDFSVSNEKSITVTLSDLDITQNLGYLQLSGLLNSNGSQYEIVAEGDLYPVDGGGYYDGNLLIGDMKTYDSLFSIVQFRLDSKHTTPVKLIKEKMPEYEYLLSVGIENTKTGEVYYLQGEIANSDFYKAKEAANQKYDINKQSKDFNEEDYKTKVLSLLNINNALTNKKYVEDAKNDISSPKDEGEIGILLNESVSYSNLNSLLTALRNNGYAYLTSYNVNEKIFLDGGWGQYHTSSSPAFYYHRYGHQQIGSTLVQISMVDVFRGVESPNTTWLQLQVKHGMVVEYIHSTKRINVMYYNTGLRFNNLQLNMGQLKDQNVYINRLISGVLSSGGSAAKGIIGLVPYLNVGYAFWDWLVEDTTTQNLNTTIQFDPTYSEQLARYGNKVIRGVVGDFSRYTLQGQGHYGLVKGRIYTPSSYTWNWTYRSTAYTNL